MILLSSVILFFYTFFIIYLIKGIGLVKDYVPKTTSTTTRFSIIIPFRNEKENLPKLISSFEKLNYPTTLFEVIFVDDFSNDGYDIQISDTIKTSILKVSNQTKSSKKEALTLGIHNANFEWIVTTDADCEVPKNWLQIIDNFIQSTSFEMVVMPVKYSVQHTFLYHFQNIEMLSLQGITRGSFGINKPFMCNGANFAYQKSFFYHLNGFTDNAHIPSGDDVFLLQKALEKNAKKVGYLASQEVVITTKVAQNWLELIHQKIRWASKTKAYSINFAKILALVFVFANFTTFISSIAYCITFEKVYILFIGAKIFVDTLLIFKSNIFYKSKINYLILSSLFYPFFACFIFFKSLTGNYHWKGKRITTNR